MPIIIIGAGGHATVCVELVLQLKKPILGFIAPIESTLKNYPSIAYLGNDATITRYSPQEVKLVNGVGSISPQKNGKRQRIFDNFKEQGYSFETLIHPCAIVASTVQLGEGTQVMANAVIQPNTMVAENVIINTSASIDHDCQLGANVHVAPGVTISGNVIVGNNAHIGVGATVIQGIHIGDNAFICAGVTVMRDVLSSQKISPVLVD